MSSDTLLGGIDFMDVVALKHRHILFTVRRDLPKKDAITMSEYRILADSTAADLVRKVQEALRQGWQPLGGVSCTSFAAGNYHIYRYAQAMVR